MPCAVIRRENFWVDQFELETDTTFSLKANATAALRQSMLAISYRLCWIWASWRKKKPSIILRLGAKLLGKIAITRQW